MPLARCEKIAAKPHLPPAPVRENVTAQMSGTRRVGEPRSTNEQHLSLSR
jgi:hypothetical protein